MPDPVYSSFDLGVGNLICHPLGLNSFTGDISGHSGDKNFPR